MLRTLVAVLLFIPSVLFCQTSSIPFGSIRGQVTDARSGEPLIGVNIIVVGSKPGHGAASDMNGMFRMNKIPPGEYVVKAVYIDYQSVTLQKVKVEAGQTTDADFAMRKEGDTEPVVEKTVADTVAKKDSTKEAAADSVK